MSNQELLVKRVRENAIRDHNVKIRKINKDKYPMGKFSMSSFSKVCKVCLVEKEHIYFVWHSHNKNPLLDTCTDCYNAKSRKLKKKRGKVKTYPRIDDDILVKCNRCFVEKPAIEYYSCRNHKNGLNYYCKECEKARVTRNNRKKINVKTPVKEKSVRAKKSVEWRRIKVSDLVVGDDVIFMAPGLAGIKAIRRVKDIVKFFRTSKIYFEKHNKGYYWDHLEEVDVVDHKKLN